MPYYMYVTVSEEDKIAVFQMDPDSGRLDHLRDVAVSGRPAPLAINPDRQVLHVGRRGLPEISSYAIDQSNGDLTFRSTAKLETDPCYLSTDRKGRFLLSSYYEGARVAIFPLGDDGSVPSSPAQVVPTATGAHCIQSDPTNRFVFVPHISGRGPNLIRQFRFDENTGQLTPNSPHQVAPESRVGPRHYCFHPNRDILYFSNEQGCSVTAYNLDPAQGTLTPFQTISTLPVGYAGPNSCAQIQIDPTGRFLYAPNRGHNTMACYRVSQRDGQLESIGHAETEAIPRAFTIDPQGKFLYSAGLESGKLAAFHISQGSGQLERMETYNVGKAPMWVLITELG
jgi:6-phosphogluconolactonase